ncbi:MAG TPA: SIR2 family protein [Solirubrobacterales bacterium]
MGFDASDIEQELVLARCVEQLRLAPGHYAFLLGAGMSAGAGIPLGGAIVTMLRQRLVEELRRDISPEAGESLFEELGWFRDPDAEYAEALQRAFSSDHERQRFFRDLIAGKMPTLAHYYLASIIANGHCNLVLTTNFDDLLEKALASLRLDEFNVVAHASESEYLAVNPELVTVVKLHGHYTFPQLSNLSSDTKRLQRRLREYFEFLMRDHGLIVAGYAGRDRSIMDPITRSLRDRTIPRGVVWCIRRREAVAETSYLRELERLGAGNVRFLGIQDMDDFYRDLHQRLGLPDHKVLDALSADRHRYQQKKMLQRLSTSMSLDLQEAAIDNELRYVLIRRHDEVDMVENTLRSIRRLRVRNITSAPISGLRHAEYGENKITHAELSLSGRCTQTSEELEFRPLCDPGISFCRVFEMALPSPLEPGEETEIEYRLHWPGEPAHYGQPPHSQSVSLIRYRRGVERLEFSVAVRTAADAPLTRAWVFGLSDDYEEHQVVEDSRIRKSSGMFHFGFETSRPRDCLYLLYYMLGVDPATPPVPLATREVGQSAS